MARKAEQPGFVPPMMPVTADAPPAGGDWLHELAYDGCWAQLVVGGRGARAFSAGGEDWTDRCRPLAEAAAGLGCRAAAIDGEMIVEDSDGRPDPAALRAAIAGRPERLVFMAFDLLHLDGRALRGEPLEVRRALLEELVGAKAPGGRSSSAHMSKPRVRISCAPSRAPASPGSCRRSGQAAIEAVFRGAGSR